MMKSNFLAGVSVGLMVGIVIGFFTAHFWTWLFIGLVAAIAALAWYKRRKARYRLVRV